MDYPTTRTFVHDLSSTTSDLRQSSTSYTSITASTLMTKSDLFDLHLGTGASLYASINSLLLSTNAELVLVTCFWAPSRSLDILSSTLRELSNKALERDPTGKLKIRVRICLSSLSLWQKLFQPQKRFGHVYPPEQWEKTLGLPSPQNLTGLDLEVRCKFFLPLSVMHPKFIMIDDQTVVLPSCNVSWEDWFEGGVTLRGDVVNHFRGFWERHWDGELTLPKQVASVRKVSVMEPLQHHSQSALPQHITLDLESIDTVFLESDYHVNPRFMPFPWQSPPAPPRTPLNTFLLSLFRTVEKRIYIQTPNVTAMPVLNAIVDMLRRGIDVHIVTSERLMILEQVVTAGTTTFKCMQELIKRYRDVRIATQLQSPTQERLMEEGHVRLPGRLVIEYYQPVEDRSQTTAACAEPVQSHLKLTIADDELTILGSGNMDRASWYTSQELGVAFFSPSLATTLRNTLEDVLRHRKRLLFDSNKNS